MRGEREAFETFAQNCPMGRYNVTRKGEGYDSSHTQIMWDTWQTRAAQPAPVVPDDHPLMIFAKECELGAYMEHEVPLAARKAIAASKKKG